MWRRLCFAADLFVHERDQEQLSQLPLKCPKCGKDSCLYRQLVYEDEGPSAEVPTMIGAVGCWLTAVLDAWKLCACLVDVFVALLELLEMAGLHPRDRCLEQSLLSAHPHMKK